MEQIIASLNLEIQALKNALSDRVQINTLIAQAGALMGRTSSSLRGRLDGSLEGDVQMIGLLIHLIIVLLVVALFSGSRAAAPLVLLPAPLCNSHPKVGVTDCAGGCLLRSAALGGWG